MYNILLDATLKCNSKCISLSGGLDSSILACLLDKKNISAICIISKESPGNDLIFSQIIAKKFSIPIKIKMIDIDELLSAVNETIKILKVFNDIEIRNAVVMYLSLLAVKKNGFSSVITGDGADELFAGYNFWLKMNNNEVQNDLKRIRKIMHFPTQEIGKKLGIKVESPFLSQKVMDFAKSLPLDYKINMQNGKKYGKWILRKTFEKKIPNSIVWRKKSAMQDGAGTSGLIDLFSAMLPNKFFNEQTKRIKESENVIIKSKESLYYYMIYRKYFDIPSDLHSSKSKCPNCQYKIELGSKFCRMCGAFPI